MYGFFLLVWYLHKMLYASFETLQPVSSPRGLLNLVKTGTYLE